MTPHAIDNGKAEALAWLVDRLRFEAFLTDLRRRDDTAAAPASFVARAERRTTSAEDDFAAVPTAAA